ncbi:MAG: hypothetical protein IJ027_00600, partial [Oscillospiraceae bacterium]|nr:hypothetical protein [Oscillospiraceae bacterium]
QSGTASSYVTNRVGVSPTNVAVSFEKHSESKTIVRIYVDGVQEFSQPFDTALTQGTVLCVKTSIKGKR